MDEQKYELIINRGIKKGFEHKFLDKKSFLRESSYLLKRPKKIFLGLGDFLEVGDYNQLLDTTFHSRDSIKLENILDKNNRKIAKFGEIPFSFYKLGVYFPDFLLKDIPIFCVTAIGSKARLFPGAEIFVKYVKEFDPLILTAIPHEIAIEIVKRVGLEEKNLISTKYKTVEENKTLLYAGDIERFISGNRKSLEIEKIMGMEDIREDEILYVGRGEAGLKTFSTVNSLAFNPSDGVIPESNFTLYGSSLKSLLVLFNFTGELEKFFISDAAEEFLPSLLVYSEVREKRDDLIAIERQHRQMQNNIIGQRIELSGESFNSVARGLEIAFGGSSVDINKVRKIIGTRIESFNNNPQEFVKKIHGIAKERYKNLCSV